MKTKFQRMSIKERKQEIKKFKKDNKNLYNAIIRLKVIGIFGMIYSIFLFILNFLQHSKIFDYIIAGTVSIASVIFLITAYDFLYKHVNDYIIKKK